MRTTMVIGSLSLTYQWRWTTKLCCLRSVSTGRDELDAAFAILTKWFSLTRLETRTKESNIYASIWVENPDAQ